MTIYGIIDFETNTHNPGDVIECSVRKVKAEGSTLTEISHFHRFYFSHFPVNMRAFEVHNLTPDDILKRRIDTKADYPELFVEDYGFESFFSDIDVIVAHNLSFENRHIGDRLKISNEICTMKHNRHDVQAKNIRGALKNPNLGEACKHYNVPFSEEHHHGAEYDTEVTLHILEKMIKNNHKIIPCEKIESSFPSTDNNENTFTVTR